MSDIIIGRIKSREVNSFKKEEYVVRVDIPEVNENVIAFPLSHLDEPQIDDEVILFSMNPSLNNVYLYYPLKKFYLKFKELTILQTVSEEFKKQKQQTLSAESSLLHQKGQALSDLF
jgi:hypothetical protein